MGDFTFHPIILDEPFRVYRHAVDKTSAILTEPGQRFTAEGFYDGANGELSSDAWLPDWRVEGDALIANRIAPDGRSRRDPVRLALSEWSPAPNASSAVLNIHIPRGPRIVMDDWGDSISRAFAFFETVQPTVARAVACVCKSWLFDPRLQTLLPENSGIVSPQKRLGVFPLCSVNGRCGLVFIFGDQNIDLSRAPRDTSLRREVIDYLSAGGALTGGGFVLFKDRIAAAFAPTRNASVD